MKPSINFLREVRWTSLHIVAVLVIGLGIYGVLSFLIKDLPRSSPFSTEPITNPVYWNDQRITPDKALHQLTRDFTGNFATVIGFSAFIILLSVHYFSVVHGLYSHAPVRSLIASVFLGGSVLCGLLVGLSLMRVNEFAFQVTSGGHEQKDWLRTGIGFLIQIHLVYVYGWLEVLPQHFLLHNDYRSHHYRSHHKIVKNASVCCRKNTLFCRISMQ